MVVVQVAEGQLRGSEEVLPSGGAYYSFKGIPYAQAPVGVLRFKDPQPPIQWEGVRDASNHGRHCPQQPDPVFSMGQELNCDEDCLYLNVYTRNINPHSKTPVMLWIHGGSFKTGNGDAALFGPTFLVKHNVVLVTINYRLEAFGFLCLDTAGVPGNAGLKDQVAAMIWVKQNIENFGGDPDDVTIFGESAGGVSVALQLVTPLAKGLFSKAIVQSGSNISDWSHTSNGREIAFRLGKALGKDTTDEVELLDFLQNVPASELVNSTKKVIQYEHNEDNILFLPVIEKDFGLPRFLTKNPLESLTSGEVADVPVAIGVTSGEGLILLQRDLLRLETINENPEIFLTKELKADRSPNELKRIGREIQDFYFRGSFVSEDTVPQLVNVESDLVFVYPVYRLAKLLANNNSSPVYFYYFDYIGQRVPFDGIFKGKFAQQVPLACHAAENMYLFDVASLPPPEAGSPTEEFINKLTTLWTNFAKKGTPTPDSQLAVKWDRFSPELRNYLNIDATLTSRRGFLADRMQFWESLYQAHGLPV